MGRPPYYDTPEQLELAIDAYFDGLEVKNESGIVVRTRPPTTAGLAIGLGFCDRQSLYDQLNREPDFSCPIKKALTYIESFHEENLVSGRVPTGSIFWMKNHGWKDHADEDKNQSVIEKLDEVLGKIDGAI